jgi:hypothetical protein
MTCFQPDEMMPKKGEAESSFFVFLYLNIALSLPKMGMN